MGGQKTCGKANCKDSQGNPRFLMKCFQERRKDNKRGIGENRNRYNVARDSHGKGCMFLPHHTNCVESHPVGSFCSIEEISHHDAKNDDDTNALDGPRKTACNGFDRSRAAHSRKKAHDKSRCKEADESIGLDFKCQSKKDNHPNDKNKFNWHILFLLLCFSHQGFTDHILDTAAFQNI